MIDDVTYDVHPEIARALPREIIEAPEVQEEAPQVQIIEQQAQAQTQAQPDHDSPAAINWRVAREKEKRLQYERDEAVRLAQEMQQRYGPQQQTKSEEIDDVSIGNDDIVEGKHLSKVQKKLKQMEAQLNEYKQHSTNYSAETRLRAQYPDFDRICTPQNLETLTYAYPELASTLRSSGDLYATGVSAYTLIKKFNIDQTHEVDVDRAQKNISKPKPTNTISPQQGDNPLSRANAFASGLTEDLKKQLMKEMQDSRRNY